MSNVTPIKGGRSRKFKRRSEMSKGEKFWRDLKGFFKELGKLLGIILLFIAVIALFLGLGALVVLFAWNVGLKAVVEACGGSISSINLLEALGVSILLNLLRRPKITRTA